MRKVKTILALLCGATLSFGFGVACTTTNETATNADTVAQSNAVEHLVVGDITNPVIENGTGNIPQDNQEMQSERQTALTVAQVSALKQTTEVFVTGYFAGVSDEGPNADKEMLIKDKTTDDIIAVRGVPYGQELDYGYEVGDEVAFYATLKMDLTASTPYKKFLDFSTEKNDLTDITTTIVSKDNKVNYALTNAVEVKSWSDMKEVFQVGAIREYTYVKMSGTFYVNEYLGAGNVTSYRFHMNGNAKISANAKVDGSRWVTLRDSAMVANLGDDWTSAFFDETDKNFPGIAVTTTFYALYTGATSAYFQLNVLDYAWVSAYQYSNAEIIKEVAEAYLRQGKQINYNQTGSTGLRAETASPEDATAQHTLYLDCSSYANAVYYEAFGEYILDKVTVPIERQAGVWEDDTYDWKNVGPSTANMRNYGRYVTNAINAGKVTANDYPDMVGYWQLRDVTTGELLPEYDTEEEQTALLTSVQAMLQVGDLIVYRHGSQSNKTTPCDTAGHVVVYVGDDTFYHVYSTGKTGGSDYEVNLDNPHLSYDMNPVEDGKEKVIGSFASSELFTKKTGGRYLFKSETADSMGNFTLLRPLARNTFKATEKTLKRMKIAGLAMEKTSSVGLNNAVNPSDEITYTITLTNTKATALKNITVADVLPVSTTYATNSATLNGVATTDGLMVDGQNLKWKVTVEANAEVTLAYTVRVNSTAVAGTVLASDKTTVGGVLINEITHTVAGYTSVQLASVATSATNSATNSTTYTNPIDFAKSAYSGVDANLFSGYSTVGAVLDEVIDETNLTCKTDTAIAKMLVPNTYGGYDIRTGMRKLQDNERVRRVLESNLAVGDIILAEWSDGAKTIVYLYVGNSQLVCVSSVKATFNQPSETTVTATAKTATALTIGTNYFGTTADSVLVSLVAYERFAILRPSMCIANA